MKSQPQIAIFLFAVTQFPQICQSNGCRKNDVSENIRRQARRGAIYRALNIAVCKTDKSRPYNCFPIRHCVKRSVVGAKKTGAGIPAPAFVCVRQGAIKRALPLP